MNTEIKSKWLEALRSGNYDQGVGHLRSTDNKFCCLGVLADVVDPTWVVYNDHIDYYEHASGGSNLLPVHFMEEVDPEGHLDAQSDTLVTMNDEEGRSFAEIADWIEVNL